jgi:hypothetical protein
MESTASRVRSRLMDHLATVGDCSPGFEPNAR